MTLMLDGPSVYLDYAASTPPDPEVVAAMAAHLADRHGFANPSSTHVNGRHAAAAVALARRQLARLLDVSPDTLVLTSGATESDNLAIQGAARFRAHRGRHLVTMRTEHKAVSNTFRALENDGFDVTWLPPDAHGRLAVAALEAALRDDTQLVSVMHINNETGAVQDIDAIGRCCRARDVLFHTDAAQSVGKLPIALSALPVDLLSLTAHKFYGPQGIGALYVADRPGCGLEPLLQGGGQQGRYRPGTLPVHQVAGLGVAAELAGARMDEDLARVRARRNELWDALRVLPGVTVNGDPGSAYPGILNVSAGAIDGESLLLALTPLCVARGAACNSTSGEASVVLRELGLDDAAAQSAIRFSFGRETTAADIEIAVQRYTSAVSHLRAIAPPAANC